MKSITAAIAGAAVAAVAIGGVSLAVGANDPLYACVTTRTGAVRMVSAATVCSVKTETKITWNVRGPAGAVGVAGPQGVPGVAGPQGTSAASWSLRDSNGADLGQIFSISGDPMGQSETFVARKEGHWVAYGNGARAPRLTLYYESDDCTGQPLSEVIASDMSWMFRNATPVVYGFFGMKEVESWGATLTGYTLVNSYGDGPAPDGYCAPYGQQIEGLAPVTLGVAQPLPATPFSVVPSP